MKPSNILVDETGQTKVLDFGVARAVDNDGQATRQTDAGQLVGTLACMSPEQVLTDPAEIDIRSDVYALGTLLYEVLAGKLPLNTRGKLPEVIQAIREEDPAPLGRLDRRYKGDIETIAIKALEKDKTQRYTSAAQLAADIRRPRRVSWKPRFSYAAGSVWISVKILSSRFKESASADTKIGAALGDIITGKPHCEIVRRRCARGRIIRGPSSGPGARRHIAPGRQASRRMRAARHSGSRAHAEFNGVSGSNRSRVLLAIRTGIA